MRSTAKQIGVLAILGAGCALAGCNAFPSPTVTASLPDVPADIRTCFVQLVPAPASGALTQRQIVQLVAALRQSEAAKSTCGKRLLAFYDAEKEALK